MPWSISPRLASGSMIYGLLVSQVLRGDGSSFAQVALEICHNNKTTPTPMSGNTSQSNLNVFIKFHEQTTMHPLIRKAASPHPGPLPSVGWSGEGEQFVAFPLSNASWPFGSEPKSSIV